MDHSAFDSYAFLFESAGKKVLYSGDFREHGRKSKAFHWFLKEVPEKVDALLLEGTLMDGRKEPQETEEEIEKKIIAAIRNSKSITLCLFSSQNIDRIVSVFKAALKSGKLFVIDVYTANVLDSLKDLSNIPNPSKRFSNIKVVFPKRICDRLVKDGKYELMRKFKNYKIAKKEIEENPSDFVMAVKTSMLFDLSLIKGIEGGTVIYSMWEGYLKDRSMERFFEFIKNRQMEIVRIHTSGHASMDTLKKVVEKTKPKVLIPIHTFYPERFSELSPNVLQASDGLEIEI
jgi:ribonuclease J